MKRLPLVGLFIMLMACSQNQTDPLPDYYFASPSFEWRLDALPDNYTTQADYIDIDGFESSVELVANLKAQGATVIAYLSVGSVENFRSDADQFPPEVVGNVYEGFEDENWLDISNLNALAPILTARLDMIQAKGFDGIEPDNIDGYLNNTGFSLTQNDAKIFCAWLIAEAHARGLSIGQKNAPELAAQMVDDFDWMLCESPFSHNWYEYTTPYLEQGKPVFATEYDDDTGLNDFENNYCSIAQKLGVYAIYKDRNLTQPAITCD